MDGTLYGITYQAWISVVSSPVQNHNSLATLSGSQAVPNALDTGGNAILGEVMNMSESGASWVRARAKCTIEENFKVIGSALDQAITAFNALDSSKRRERLFWRTHNETILEIYRARKIYNAGMEQDPGHKDDVVRVRCAASSIIAYRRDHWNFEIIPKWNPATLSCDFLIEGQEVTVSHISQKILGDFMFE